MSEQQILGGPCRKCGAHHSGKTCGQHQADLRATVDQLLADIKDDRHILCVNCRATFSESEIEGWGCPKCGNQGIPADTKDVSTITLTNHEWRILTIWADNWAHKVCAKDQTPGCDSVACITAILNEMRRQSPNLDGLTIRDQIQDIVDAFNTTAEMHSDGEKEIFEPKKRN